MSPKLSALLDVQQISDITKVINKETLKDPYMLEMQLQKSNLMIQLKLLL